jgi:7-keto-8-aminopelargonate synthetase-like enzyme
MGLLRVGGRADADATAAPSRIAAQAGLAETPILPMLIIPSATTLAFREPCPRQGFWSGGICFGTVRASSHLGRVVPLRIQFRGLSRMASLAL